MNRWITLFLCASLSQHLAYAKAYSLDDSQSQLFTGSVPMQWEHFFPRRGQPDRLIGQFRVLVRLNVADWQGRTVRIYQKLPSYSTGPFQVTWQSEGYLLNGTMHDGERVLIRQGRIDRASIEDTLQFQVIVDSNQLSRAQQMEFTYEIEPE